MIRLKTPPADWAFLDGCPIRAAARIWATVYRTKCMAPPARISPGEKEQFRKDLMVWYRANARDLPWRRSDDPYLIWISEVMLQQTRVDQAIPYFERFIERFPNVEALASASLDDVLLVWEGLGYYSRARNLHRAAQEVARDFEGRFPDDPRNARALAGVGPYTSSAILSIAYGKKEAAVDGNVTRVLARYLALEAPVDRAEGRRAIQDLAEGLIDDADPGTFNQAMMELGATVCLPTRPLCNGCPIARSCRGHRAGSVEEYPHVRRKGAVPHQEVAVGVIINDSDEVLLTRRPYDALLGGLWEFPGARRQDGESLEDACRRGVANVLGLNIEPITELVAVRHAFSHFKITLHAFSCKADGPAVVTESTRSFRWIGRSDLGSVALHRAARKVADLIASGEVSSSWEPV